MEKTTFYLHDVLEDNHWWFASRAYIVHKILQRFTAGQTRPLIVDIGCGTGGIVNYLSSDFRCVGVDSSDLAIKIAVDKYPNRQFKCGDIEEFLENLEDEVSCVLLMDVLEHIENDVEFLQNVVDILPTGAKIIITVPAGKSLWSKHDVSAHHFRRYEFDEFVQLWPGMSLKTNGVTYYNSRLYPLIKLVRFLGNRFGLTWGNSGTDFSLPPLFLNKLFARIFSGESKRILGVLEGNCKPFSRGVSLLAILEKT